jgi:cellulose synthase/poly-beta-1,6-N-acetylglucosamine synthase-like glycosyltransferase
VTDLSTTTLERPDADPRLDQAVWGTAPLGARTPLRLRLLLAVNLLATVWYFGWLLEPSRVGNPVLYGVLVAAEVLNVVQAAGFWWTLSAERRHRAAPPTGQSEVHASVDVLVPRYSEPASIVEPTLAAAVRMRGDDVRVWLLDDGDSDEMEQLAHRLGAGYLRRAEHDGAKAGNINAALQRTTGEFVVVLDCDHVPHPDFLTRTLPSIADPKVAFVQTPQYYANAHDNPVAAASWSQQALFFGCIARGKSGAGSMFCCGTNVVFRRAALEDVGGFPVDSVTEDFLLSLQLQERGWRTAYVDEVLAQGLGPEDMASYASQQLRWARGCLSAIGRTLRSTLPLRIKTQYLLSSAYFLSGWTVLVYMLLPVTRILTGAQPLAASGADLFLAHFAPYFALSLLTVAVAGGGRYSFAAYATAAAGFWIHVSATIAVLLRRPGGFVVTPKSGSVGWQPAAVWPALLAIGALLGSVAVGLAHSRDAAMLNNVTFALLHVVVLLNGVSAALSPRWARRVLAPARAPVRTPVVAR